jgi:hypothetical protein
MFLLLLAVISLVVSMLELLNEKAIIVNRFG